MNTNSNTKTEFVQIAAMHGYKAAGDRNSVCDFYALEEKHLFKNGFSSQGYVEVIEMVTVPVGSSEHESAVSNSAPDLRPVNWNNIDRQYLLRMLLGREL